MALAAILLVAAYVRLAHSDLTWFSIDQARDAYVATGIASGRLLPLVGVAVEGSLAHTWGPLYFYLLAVPFGLSRDPSIAVTFLSALAVASVFLTYRLGKAFFGTRIGIFAAALFATYPVNVIGARAMSNTVLLPFFAVIFFHALFSLIVNRRSSMIILAMATLAVLVQLHLSTVPLLVVLCVALALFKPRIRATHVLIGFATVLLLLSPYLAAQVVSEFRDLRALFSYGTGQIRLKWPWELYPVADLVLFASPRVIGALRGLEPTWGSGLGPFLHWLEAWWLLLGIAWVCVTVVLNIVRRREPSPLAADILLTLWLIVPFVLLAQKSRLNYYYFDVAYPAAFLAASILLSTLLDRLAHAARPWYRPYVPVAVYTVVGLIVISQVDFHRQFWKAIQVDGAVLWDPGQSAPPIEIMPIRYKQGLVRALRQGFGVDRDGFFHRVHGSRFRDLLEDNGYFFETIAGGASGGVEPSAGPTLHYVIGRDEQSRTPGVTAVGPYTIRQYAPLIDYDGWSCTYDVPPAPRGRASVVAQRWVPLRLPTARVPDLATPGLTPFRSWQSLPVSCRGTITPSGPSQLQLVVSLRAFAPGRHHVAGFYLNGQEFTARRADSHSTLLTHSRDVVFDLSERLRAGRNEIAIQIAGQGFEFDLDVYEISR